MSSVKDTAIRQYARQLDDAARQCAGLTPPKEGWITTMRKALEMSAPELARRLGVTKPAIYQAERKERIGGITLQHMERLAEAMGGEFVYAIVPNASVRDVLYSQAREKAKQTVKRASAHMALEQQSLTPQQLNQEIERLAEELLRDRPSDFWEAS
ncbi:mobile mystery protein A [Litoreibacter roseus]|uniref:Transcriptional regulator n=1 Tax=Litoreibacter roseus TaxID=2601869 RepID=A0A6N6JHH0_9RHOB|nr:mobile mystery protein A [Litoreibacter roseus]GFE65564.1 transcriptional regulator [Litoreibacter roseus]